MKTGMLIGRICWRMFVSVMLILIVSYMGQTNIRIDQAERTVYDSFREATNEVGFVSFKIDYAREETAKLKQRLTNLEYQLQNHRHLQ